MMSLTARKTTATQAAPRVARAQRVRLGAEVIPFPIAASLEPVMVGEDVMRRKAAVDIALTFRPVEYEAWVRAGEGLARQP